MDIHAAPEGASAILSAGASRSQRTTDPVDGERARGLFGRCAVPGVVVTEDMFPSSLSANGPGHLGGRCLYGWRQPSRPSRSIMNCPAFVSVSLSRTPEFDAEQPSPERDEFLTVHEIAEVLKVNQQTVRNYRGELGAVRIGPRRVRVRRAHFDAFIEQRGSAGRSTGPSTAARLGALEQRVTELAESIDRLLQA
jgi:excisionase family DNA binding protein